MNSDEWKADLDRRVKAQRAAMKVNDQQNPVRPLCRHCRKPLNRYSGRRFGSIRQWGRNGDNLFCGIG
jgi:hypothetical protein